MSIVSPYDVTDEDFVRSIRIHDEWHAVGLNDSSPLPETIDPPEQCDGCGSTVSEDDENNRALTLHKLHAGDAWPLRLNQQGAYECTRPWCGKVYRVHLHVVKDTVF